MDSKKDKLHFQHDGRNMLGTISGLSWDIIESYYDKSHLEKLVSSSIGVLQLLY